MSSPFRRDALYHRDSAARYSHQRFQGDPFNGDGFTLQYCGFALAALIAAALSSHLMVSQVSQLLTSGRGPSCPSSLSGTTESPSVAGRLRDAHVWHLFPPFRWSVLSGRDCGFGHDLCDPLFARGGSTFKHHQRQVTESTWWIRRPNLCFHMHGWLHRLSLARIHYHGSQTFLGLVQSSPICDFRLFNPSLKVDKASSESLYFVFHDSISLLLT